MISLGEAIPLFLESLRLDRGASDNTISAYRRDLTQFSNHIGIDRCLHQVTSDDLANFVQDLSTEPSTLARKMSALRQFFKFCCLEHGLQTNPTENLSSPQTLSPHSAASHERSNPRAPHGTDTGLPYVQTVKTEALKARDSAMVYLLYASGLRVSELVSLTTHDLDLASAYVRVKGKGSKERVAPFAPLAGDRLQSYLEIRRAELPQGRPSFHQSPADPPSPVRHFGKFSAKSR